MEITKRINIELLSKSFVKRIPVVQNDRGRKLECYITDCKIPDGTKVRFWAMKPSKKRIYNDCTVKGNVVTVILTNQTLAEKGVVACQLEFDDDVSTYEFALDVERDLSGNGVESENESTILDGLLEELRKTITETKVAAGNADTAAGNANSAAEEARNAARNANTATGNANSAAEEARNAAGNANTATGNANSAAEEARNAARNANTATGNANSAAEEARNAARNANTATGNANSAAEEAEEAAEKAKEAAEEAKMAAEESETPIKEVKDSYITADGTFQGSAIIKKINGGTKQVKTNGYQLFDASKLPTKSQGGATVKNNGDGSFTISGSGKLTDNYINAYTILKEEIDFLKEGALKVNDNVSMPVFYCIGYKNSDVLFSTLRGVVNITPQILNDLTHITLLFYGSASEDIVPNTVKPMLYQDGDGTWEPFTGGHPSPSPDYPQEVKGIGSNGYFDGEWRQGWINSSNGNVEIIRNNVIHGINKIPCENLDSIQLQYEEVIDYLAVAFYKEDGTFLSSKASNKNVRQFTVQPPIGAKYFIPEVQKDVGITPQTARKIEVLINGKYAVKVETHCRNVLNKKSVYDSLVKPDVKKDVYVIEKTSGKTTGYATFEIPIPIEELKGKTIVFSDYKYKRLVGTDNDFVWLYGLDDAKIPMGSFKKQVTPNDKILIPIDIGKDNKSLAILLYCNGTVGGKSEYSNIYAYLEETPLDEWEPYKESVSYIPLDSPLYEGDRIYLEDGELWEYRENARVVFDGSMDEDWYTRYYSNFCAYIKITNMIEGISFCNKFNFTFGGMSNKPDGTIGFSIEGVGIEQSGFFFGIKEIATDTPTWRAWLQQNPVEVVYKLKEPTLKKLGSAEAFTLRTFDGVTYIEVVGSSELGTENTFIVPKNQSGGIMTDAFCTAKRNEINMAEQANLASRISVLEKLAVREG